jgi:hypothetical protein
VSDLESKAHALYRFFGADGALLYIGITASLPNRLARHKEDKPWWCDVADIRVEHFQSRRAVLEAERAAIVAEKPLHNVRHNGLTARPAPASPASVAFGLEVGFVVALMTDLTTKTKCFVGEVQAIDDMGVRVTLMDWFVGMFCREDLFVPWPRVVGAAVWTAEHSIRSTEDFAKWQRDFEGDWGPKKAEADS